jgi:transposase
MRTAWPCRYRAARDGIERSHFQIIWRLSQGYTAQYVACVTGYSARWISTILWRYNDYGVDGLGDQRQNNPGAAPLLDEAHQEPLEQTLEAPPPDGGLWTGRKVAQWMAGRRGRLVSPQRGIDYLRRLEFTPQVPRPCHAGADAGAHELFKKTSEAGS